MDSYFGEESNEDSIENWLKTDIYDNVLLKPKKEKESKMYETKSPTIMIWDDEDLDNIEIAKIESYYDRMSTPEGNVKYKNYKVLAPSNAPIRMYSPSGDINTTPKKRKIVPKFEIDKSAMHKEKIISLIDDEMPYAEDLKAIIKPTGLSPQNMEALRRTNASCLDDYLQFLNSVNFTPSPSFSMFSDDASKYLSPPITPEKTPYLRNLLRSCSIEENGRLPKRILQRQISVPNPGENYAQCLSDELNQAERFRLRSHTPMSMTFSDYRSYSRPLSSLSGNTMARNRSLESKKAILRSFVQRNMIVRAANRDKLAKLALAIEEDGEDFDYTDVESSKIMENKVYSMIEEMKELKEDLMEIQDGLQVSTYIFLIESITNRLIDCCNNFRKTIKEYVT